MSIARLHEKITKEIPNSDEQKAIDRYIGNNLNDTSLSIDFFEYLEAYRHINIKPNERECLNKIIQGSPKIRADLMRIFQISEPTLSPTADTVVANFFGAMFSPSNESSQKKSVTPISDAKKTMMVKSEPRKTVNKEVNEACRVKVSMEPVTRLIPVVSSIN